MSKYKTLNAKGVLAIHRALNIRGHTREELAFISGFSPFVIARVLAELRDEIYIKKWNTDRMGRHNIEVWTWGNKKDAARPKT